MRENGQKVREVPERCEKLEDLVFGNGQATTREAGTQAAKTTIYRIFLFLWRVAPKLCAQSRVAGKGAYRSRVAGKGTYQSRVAAEEPPRQHQTLMPQRFQ